MRKRLAESVEFPHHERIASLQFGQTGGEACAVILRSARAILMEVALLDAAGDQGILLQAYRLPIIGRSGPRVARSSLRKTLAQRLPGHDSIQQGCRAENWGLKPPSGARPRDARKSDVFRKGVASPKVPCSPVGVTRFYIPSDGPEAWRQLLAKPSLHWAKGYSARTLAYSWEAGPLGLPDEVREALRPVIGGVDLLLALPEHKTPLPGSRRDSQSDIFALMRSQRSLIAATVEGKVDEPFGPTLVEWLKDASSGKLERLYCIKLALGLQGELPGTTRYQLLHRTAAAVLEAERFKAETAAMIVHSFSPERLWFHDFSDFVDLLGGERRNESAATVRLPDGKTLILVWASGDQHYRTL